MTVTSCTKLVEALSFEPAPASIVAHIGHCLWSVSLGLAPPAYLWAKGRNPAEAFPFEQVAG